MIPVKSNIVLMDTAIVLAFSAMFTAAAAGPETGKHLFILSGQSNMRSPLPESFKSAVEQVLGKDKVIMVVRAKPSQPIKQWYKNWTLSDNGAPANPDGKTASVPDGGIYDALIKDVERAINAQKLASVTSIWMQGEADAESGWGGDYEKSYFGVLDQFKGDLKLKEINYELGRINDFWLTSKGVKVDIVPDAASNSRLFLDEIMINPVTK